MTRWLPLSWAVLLTVLLLGPALAPGFVLVRDMVWVPDLALRPDTLGLGSALPRAVPSDAVVAVLDELVPGIVLQKIVLLGALVGAGAGAAALVRGGLAGRLAAVSLTVWNPFVVERLAMGHWPVLLGYAAVPWLAVAGRRVAADGRIAAWAPLVLVAGSLSASAGLVSAAVLLTTALAGGVRRRSSAVLALMVLGANAPWIVAGWTHAGLATSAEGFRAFATAGDALPAPLAALSLGGIWNADVVPGSREGALAWVGLIAMLGLAAAGARRWWRMSQPGQGTALLVLWTLGVGLAVLSWAAPDVLAWTSARVPGLGVLRDGARSLALALPLTVGLVAAGADTVARAVPAAIGRGSLGAALVLLPLAVLPDAAWGLQGALATTHYPAEWRAVAARIPSGSGDALLLPLGNYRAPAWNARRPVIDPLARLLRVDTVIDDDLVVGGSTVAGEDPRAAEARSALRAASPEGRAEALRATGIRWVVVETDAGPAPAVAGTTVHEDPLLTVIRLDGPVASSEVSTVDRSLLALGWGASLVLTLAGVVAVGRAVGVRMTTLRASNATVRV